LGLPDVVILMPMPASVKSDSAFRWHPVFEISKKKNCTKEMDSSVAITDSNLLSSVNNRFQRKYSRIYPGVSRLPMGVNEVDQNGLPKVAS
jgi:hypothetical protein